MDTQHINGFVFDDEPGDNQLAYDGVPLDVVAAEGFTVQFVRETRQAAMVARACVMADEY